MDEIEGVRAHIIISYEPLHRLSQTKPVNMVPKEAQDVLPPDSRDNRNRVSTSLIVM